MDEIEKLYNGLKEQGLYSKSLDEFRAKYSTEENQRFLYDGLKEQGLYSKEFSDFTSKYFTTVEPPLKKKDSTDSISGGGISQSQTQPKDTITPISSPDVQDDTTISPIARAFQKEVKRPIANDIANAVMAGLADLGAGQVGIPNFINKAVAAAMLPKEDMEFINSLKPEQREAFINGLFEHNPVISGAPALAQSGAELQEDLNVKRDEFREKMSQYETNIIDDLAATALSTDPLQKAELAGRTTKRIMTSIAESAPAMLAFTLPAGLTLLGAGTAAQKQEEQEKEGADIGWKSLSNSTVYGIAEGFFERFTKGILKPFGQLAKGNKEVSKEIAKSTVESIAKDFGIEGSSEAATTLTQEVSDALFTGKDFSVTQLLKNMADSFIVGAAMGGGIGATKAGLAYAVGRSATSAERDNIEGSVRKRLELERIRTEENGKIVDSQIEKLNNESAEFAKVRAKELEGLSYEDYVKVSVDIPREVDGIKNLLKTEGLDPIVRADLENQIKSLENQSKEIREKPTPKELLDDVESFMNDKYGKDYDENDMSKSDFESLEKARLNAGVDKIETVSKTQKIESLNSELSRAKKENPTTYWSVDFVSKSDSEGGTVIETSGGYGFVKKDGDIKGVFKKLGSNEKGVAEAILKKAIAAGGKKLDNFDGYLTRLYKKAGFRVVSRTAFNEEYAPEGWDKKEHGTPDVVAMVYDPKNELEIEEKSFDSYDEMIEYRDSYLTKPPKDEPTKERQTGKDKTTIDQEGGDVKEEQKAVGKATEGKQEVGKADKGTSGKPKVSGVENTVNAKVASEKVINHNQDEDNSNAKIDDSVYSNAKKVVSDELLNGNSSGRSIYLGIQSIRKSEWFKNLSQERKSYVLSEFKRDMSSLLEDALTHEEHVAKEKMERIELDIHSPMKMRGYYNAFRTTVQDAMYPIKRLQKLLKKEGISISDEMNVYLIETLQAGRAMFKILDIKNKIYDEGNKNSLFGRMKKADVGLKSLGDFVTARHAAERNAKALEDLKKFKEVIADDSKENSAVRHELIKDLKSSLSINRLNDLISEIDLRISGLEDGTYAGYGMSNNDSKAILDKHTAEGTFDKFSEFADEYKNEVSDAALDMMYESGLITEESYNNMRGTYKYYAPLLVEDSDLFNESTKKIGDAYSGVHHITGSTLEKVRKNPIISGITKYNSVAINSERNRTAMTLLNLIETEMSQSDIFEVISEGEYLNLGRKRQENAIGVSVDGKKHYIYVNNPEIRDALKGIKKGIDFERVLKPLKFFNSFQRKVLTQYNPSFQAPNYVRDLQQAYFNLPSEVKESIKAPEFTSMSVRAVAGIKDYKKMQRSGKKPTTKYGKYYEDLLKYGGVSRWGFTTDPNKVSEEIEKSFDNIGDDDVSSMMKGLLRSAVDKPADILDEVGEYSEHANRLAVYVASVEAGLSKEQAAFLAKESTINFDRRGIYGDMINSLWVFSNAGIQATARMLHTMKENPKASAKTLGYVMAASAISTTLIYAFGFGDIYEDESEWDKSHNIYLPIPVKVNEKTELVKLPTPYGLNFFPYLGQKIGSYAMDRDPDKFAETTTALANSLGEILNPLGGSATPTIARPIVDVMNNRDYRDLPIHFEDIYSGLEVVKAESGKYSTGEGYKFFAKTMNRLSGGTANTSGALDLAPEDYRYILEGYAGGIYKELKNSIESLKEEEESQIPILRRFYSNPRENVGTAKLYDMYRRSGNEIFNQRQLENVKEYFNRALQESYSDEENLTKMYKKIHETQVLNILGDRTGMTRDEITGKKQTRDIKREVREEKRKKK